MEINRSDAGAIAAVKAETHMLHEHIHSVAKSYPTSTVGISITTDTTAWKFGPIVQVFSSTFQSAPWDIHFINIESYGGTTNNNYLQFYSDSSGVNVIASIRVSKGSAVEGSDGLPIMCPIQTSSTPLWAKCMGSATGVTHVFSIFYHNY